MNQENERLDFDTPKPPESPNAHERSRSQPAKRLPVLCQRCRYDLRGLTIGEHCPECGHEIGLSGAIDGPTSGFAIASLVMGILAVILGLPGLIFGPIAIWFAAKAKLSVLDGSCSPSSLGLATAGKITGIIGLCLGILSGVIILSMLSQAGISLFP